MKIKVNHRSKNNTDYQRTKTETKNDFYLRSDGDSTNEFKAKKYLHSLGASQNYLPLNDLSQKVEGDLCKWIDNAENDYELFDHILSDDLCPEDQSNKQSKRGLKGKIKEVVRKFNIKLSCKVNAIKLQRFNMTNIQRNKNTQELSPSAYFTQKAKKKKSIHVRKINFFMKSNDISSTAIIDKNILSPIKFKQIKFKKLQKLYKTQTKQKSFQTSKKSIYELNRQNSLSNTKKNTLALVYPEIKQINSLISSQNIIILQ